MATFCITGCGVDTEIYDKTLQSNPVDFTNSENFDFDTEYVELVDEKIQLKALDLEQSGADFNFGTHVGSCGLTSIISIKNSTSCGQDELISTDIRNILPHREINLVAYWKFENSLMDVHGNNEASGAGSFQSGKIAESLDLGLTGSLSVGVITELPKGASPRTYLFWFKPNNNSSGARSIVYQSNGNGSGENFSVSSEDFGISLGFVGHRSIFAKGEFSLGRWYHIAVVVPTGATMTGEVKVYIDGVERIGADEAGSTKTLNTTDRSVIIHSGENITGGLDELSLWDTDLSALEIQKIYNNQNIVFGHQTELSPHWTPKWNQIIGYWKMDGNWQDSSEKGNHGTTILGTPGFSSTDKKVGPQAATFDGTNDLIKVPHTASQNLTEFSISHWIKKESPVSGGDSFGTILAKGDGTGDSDDLNYLTAVHEATGLGRIIIGSGSTTVVCNSTTVISSGWHHFLTTAENVGSDTIVRIYINGQFESSCTLVGATANPAPGVISIGAWDTSSDFGKFPGKIDDVFLMSGVLTNLEVSQIYNRQKQKYAGHYDSAVMDLGNTTSNWQELAWTTSLPFGKELAGDVDNDGSPDNENESDYSSNIDTSDLVGLWYFNQDFQDYSGALNHGTNTGSTLTPNSILQGGIHLDGNDYIAVGPISDISDDIWSISGWFKTSTNYLEVSRASIFAINTDVISGNKIILFIGDTIAGNAGDNEIIVYDGVTAEAFDSDAVVTDGRWHHFVYTSDGATGNLFLDGLNIGTHSVDYNIVPSDLISFGQEFDGPGNTVPSDYFTGDLDEYSLWKKVLTNNEIQHLYRRGANRLKFQVKSCVDSACNCKAFNTTPVGNINDCDGDGTTNGQDLDDIYLAEFMGPGGDGSTYFSELLNRNSSDVTLDCSLNTTDSDDNVCANDEFTLTGTPRLASPLFNFDDYADSAQPVANNYFQYRVTMEADENTACSGEPCLPELTSVNLNPAGTKKYYGQTQIVNTKNPIPYTFIKSATLEADTCATFQVSNDGSNFYVWDTNKWRAPVNTSEGSTASNITANLPTFASQLGAGNLYLRALMASDTKTLCSFENFSIESSELQ